MRQRVTVHRIHWDLVGHCVLQEATEGRQLEPRRDSERREEEAGVWSEDTGVRTHLETARLQGVPEAPTRKDFTLKAVDRKRGIRIFCLTDITKCRILFKCTENALLLRANEVSDYELLLVQQQTLISWKNCRGWGVCPRTIVSTFGLIILLVGE